MTARRPGSRRSEPLSFAGGSFKDSFHAWMIFEHGPNGSYDGWAPFGSRKAARAAWLEHGDDVIAHWKRTKTNKEPTFAYAFRNWGPPNGEVDA